MSKYTDQQLTEMAKHAVAARDLGKPEWVQLLLTLVMITGLQPAECENRIRQMAEGFV